MIQVLRVRRVFRPYVLNNPRSSCNNVQRNTVLGVFRAYVLQNTASTRSISLFSTSDTPGHAVFRGSILRTLPVLQVVQDSVLRVLYCTYWSHFVRWCCDTRNTRNIRSILGSMEYNSTICAPAGAQMVELYSILPSILRIFRVFRVSQHQRTKCDQYVQYSTRSTES